MSTDVSPSRVDALASSVRSLLKGGFYAAERSIHPIRRRRAERMLSNARVRSVLFVCHGNVCRSPYGEFVFRRNFGPGVDVRSAGFIGPDRQPPQEALRAAARRGLDMADHRSTLIENSPLRHADLVVVMNAGQAREYRRQFTTTNHVLVLGDLDPEPIETRTITDPWNSAAEVFDACYDRIDRCVERLSDLVRIPA